MTELPDPTLGETLILPAYCVEVAEVLTETENHPDPTVRAIRKIVTQAALALRAAHLASGSDAPRVLPTPAAASTSEPGPRFETFTKPKRKSSAAVLLMAKHGVDAATVREWCLGEGIECPQRGSLPLHAVEAYCQANGLEAA